MCLSHDHHGTLRNAVHLLKASVVTIANFQPIASPRITPDGLRKQHCMQKESHKITADLTL